MAETLGSMIDKLSIKSIREFYIAQMMESGDRKFSKKELEQKLGILANQKKSLMAEIEQFISAAVKGEILLKDEKLKLYNKRQAMNKIGNITTLAKGIDALTRKNLQLWQLEDQARREDVGLEYIGSIKRKIDLTNQQRNDLIDKIDELLEKRAAKGHGKK